jgi:hypothetical protein
MSRSIRSALVCLLVLAVPLQGWAAAIMLYCIAAHEAPVPEAAPDHDSVAMLHAEHRHSDATVHKHASADDANDAPSSSSAHTVSCSACSACCSGTAPPCAQFGSNAEPVSFAPLAFAVQSAPVTATGGPERPPRSSLA